MGSDLGELEKFVLLALVRLGDGTWGAAVRRELRSQEPLRGGPRGEIVGRCTPPQETP